MKKELIIALALLSGCAAPSSKKVEEKNSEQQTQQQSFQQTKVPTILSSSLKDRWYSPMAYESEQSWKLFKKLYLATKRFEIAYNALDRSKSLGLLGLSQTDLFEYERVSNRSKELRPHFFSAFTATGKDSIERYDSREVFRLENVAYNTPIAASRKLPSDMKDLYDKILHLEISYGLEKGKTYSSQSKVWKK